MCDSVRLLYLLTYLLGPCTYSFPVTTRTTGSMNTVVTTHSAYLDDANLVGDVERIVVGGQAHVRLLAAVGPGGGEG